MIDKKTDPQLRKEYKSVLLVSINHKDRDTLWSAVSKHFRDNFGYIAGDERLKKKYIEDIYNKLLLHNQPIAKFMNTGVAMDLMRKDSEIADRIIKDFVWRKAPIRCIHDSFIVQAEYEGYLKRQMVKYFKEVMNTELVISITTERVQEKALKRPVANIEPEMVPVDAENENVVEGQIPDDNSRYFLEQFENEQAVYSDDDEVVKAIEIDEETLENMKYFQDIFDGKIIGSTDGAI